MSEKRVELKIRTFKVTKICDECNEGEMVRVNNNIVLTTYPEQYQHECNKCGAKRNYFVSYPRLENEYEEMEEE
jgi:uncharacterized protein with PIN domain